MATLSGNKIKNTYQALVKFSDNGNITTSAKQLTDGFGNNSPIWVSTTQVGIGVTPESGLNLHVYGDAKIGSNLTVIGNLVVEGSTTTVGTDTLTVKDPLIVLANNNTSTDAVDIGFYGKYTPSGTTLYSGLFREALTGKYRLFKGLETEPTTTVNTSGTGYTAADLVIGNLQTNGLLEESTQFKLTKDIRIFDSIPAITLQDSDSSGSASLGDIQWLDNAASQRAVISLNNAILGITSKHGGLNFATNSTPALTIDGSQNAIFNSNLDITGDLAVNTDKFTVNAANGNTLVAGTLGVTSTLTSADITTGNISAGNGIFSGGITANGTSVTNTFKSTVLINRVGQVSSLLIGSNSLDDVLIGFQTDGNSMSMGIDRSDGNAFKISDSNGSLGTDDRFKIDTTGDAFFTGLVSGITPTAAANFVTKDYVDSNITAQDLDFSGTSGTGSVDLDSQSFAVIGTANEIETSAGSQQLQIGLPDDVTIGRDLTVVREIQTFSLDVTAGASIEGLAVTGDATFAGTVKSSTYLINLTSSAGIGASLGDINGAELGPGYLTVSRDDTANAKQLSFYKNNSEHSYLETTSSGLNIGGANVGIGTDSPDAKLQIQGNIKGGSASGSAWTDAKDDIGGLDVFVGSGNTGFSVWDDSEQTTPRFIVERTGNVGIGTDSPTNGKVQIHTASAIAFSPTVFTSGANIRLQTGGTAAAGVTTGISMGVGGAAEAYIGAVQNASTYADIVFQTYHGAYGERMRIDSSGNVGIGTDSPASAFGFSKTLEIQGAANAEVNISQTDNSKDWSLGILNGSNYQQTTSGQAYVWESGGTERMRINSSGFLNLSDGAVTLNKSDGTYIIFNYNGSTKGYIGSARQIITGETQANMAVASTGDWVFGTGSSLTERMRITSGGDVEITGTYPVFSVTGTGSVGSTFKILSSQDGIGRTIIGTAGQTRAMYFENDGKTVHTEESYFDKGIFLGGSVGIGTDSPDLTGFGYTALTIVGGTTAGYAGVLELGSPTTNANGQNLGIIAFMDGSTRNAQIDVTRASSTSTSNMHFYTNGGSGIAERMRITSGGDLLVGKTSADFVTAGIELRSSGQLNVSVNADNFNFYNPTAGVYRFFVSGAGAIYATSTSINAISDVTLKENIKPLETGLNEVMKLQPRRFDWKNGDGKNIAGFVAQEVEEILPDLVSDYKYTDKETKKSLKMGDMIPTLVKAIQELTAKVEMLEKNCNCK